MRFFCSFRFLKEILFGKLKEAKFGDCLPLKKSTFIFECDIYISVACGRGAANPPTHHLPPPPPTLPLPCFLFREIIYVFLNTFVQCIPQGCYFLAIQLIARNVFSRLLEKQDLKDFLHPQIPSHNSSAAMLRNIFQGLGPLPGIYITILYLTTTGA